MFTHGAEKGHCHVGVIRHRKCPPDAGSFGPDRRARENYPFAAPTVNDRYLRVAVVLARGRHPTAVIWRSTVRTVVETFRILRGAG